MDTAARRFIPAGSDHERQIEIGTPDHGLGVEVWMEFSGYRDDASVDAVVIRVGKKEFRTVLSDWSPADQENLRSLANGLAPDDDRPYREVRERAPGVL